MDATPIQTYATLGKRLAACLSAMHVVKENKCKVNLGLKTTT
ncbi:hypothetical protein SAMN04488028_10520 [Reichenbachiella agariperforans]|uniref:Uncharacterized protein n=1 Tax=Reichenbachiella agariperforans TaxID=156994 RepID=A0A1M6SH70_REIAG|nr:hypothetical protein SAMN04488028_10520 [Reichenbachiella agariperforans]